MWGFTFRRNLSEVEESQIHEMPLLNDVYSPMDSLLEGFGCNPWIGTFLVALFSG